MMMDHEHIHWGTGNALDLAVSGLMLILIAAYILAAYSSGKRYSRWPLHRTFFWCLGVLTIGFSIAGPISNSAENDFTVHMSIHLLIGMLAPLLIVLSSPITLLMRTLTVKWARCLSRILKTRFFRLLQTPVVASILNVGGLWLLYTTDLFMVMQQNIWVHMFIQLHIFVAGYLFTVSLIPVDPTPHRFPFVHRALVLLFALAGHSILAKYLYAYPPRGVPVDEAEAGAMLMYYGGDVIDAVIILSLCYQWYRATSKKESPVVAG